ncbi:MAG: hypothetical protein ACXWDK_09045 [Aeromicrobium sp.]
MSAAIFWAIFPALLILTIVWGTSRNIKRLDTLSDFELQNLRQGANSSWMDALPAMWAVLCLVGATIALARGELFGLIWILVAAEFFLLIVVRRRASNQILAALGGRGHVEPSENDLIRGHYLRLFGFTALGLYMVSQILNSVFGDPPPDWAATLAAVFILLAFASAFALLWSTVWVFKSRQGNGPAKTSP